MIRKFEYLWCCGATCGAVGSLSAYLLFG
nr:hypothetical protein [Tanacetum cinerariifolium]